MVSRNSRPDSHEVVHPVGCDRHREVASGQDCLCGREEVNPSSTRLAFQFGRGLRNCSETDFGGIHDRPKSTRYCRSARRRLNGSFQGTTVIRTTTVATCRRAVRVDCDWDVRFWPQCSKGECHRIPSHCRSMTIHIIACRISRESTHHLVLTPGILASSCLSSAHHVCRRYVCVLTGNTACTGHSGSRQSASNLTSRPSRMSASTA